MATLRIAATLAYPLVIYLGLRFLHPRSLALCIGALLLLRLLLSHQIRSLEFRRLALLAAPVALLLGLAALFQNGRYFLFVPGLVSFALLFGFTRSLLRRHGPPMVEVFARLQIGELPADEIPSCRRVTVVWCVFLACNGGAALALAAFGSVAAWALYTGLIAYGLMGALFAGEYVYRAWRFRRYQKTLFAPIFRRIFPENPIP